MNPNKKWNSSIGTWFGRTVGGRRVSGAALLAACVLAVVGFVRPPRGDALPNGREDPIELTVYAAASTREALQAIDAKYSKEHDVKLVFNFGSSGDVSKQIIAGNKADVFLSADEKEMDRVAMEKLVLDCTRKPLLSNQLVVIESIDPAKPDFSVFSKPFAAEQLARPEIKLLSLANVESVPAGRYAKEWLEKKMQWDAVKERVLPGVDVRAALAAVESAGAQAGIVYRTDAALSKKVRVVFAVPIDEGPRISYPVAVLKDRPHVDEAKAFADYLSGPAAREIFEQKGFIVLAPKPPEKK
jgi:molybdate transport system substrate-binding protein